MIDVLKRLQESFRIGRSVSIDEMQELGVTTDYQSFYKVFTIKRGGKKTTHAVRKIVAGRGNYHLVEPATVPR